MIKIYHNPRCSKSREGIKFLENKELSYEIIKYLEEGITTEELKSIIKKLGIDSPIELVRTNEKVWKEKFKGHNYTDDELIKIMVENPKLIERPIIINDKKAVVGRPAEKIEEIL